MDSLTSLSESRAASRAASPREPLYDFGELASHFGIKIQTLSKLRRDNPTLTPWRGNKYRMSDAQAWFTQVKGQL